MALDGIVAKNIVYELNSKLIDGRIDKIYQPSREEVVLAVRAMGKNYKLLITSSADFPRIHLTETKNENPQTPPMFCMSLRKHLSGGKICGFFQPGLERIIEVKAESLNEMGDITEKRLIVEIMGKHSNIILVDHTGKIIDCAKRISFEKSSVREVLPGKQYVYPPNQNKIEPLDLLKSGFIEVLNNSKGQKVSDAIYKSFCGISPLIASEICCRANISDSAYLETVSGEQIEGLFHSFNGIMDICKENLFKPEIVYEDKNAAAFSSVPLTQFGAMKKVEYQHISPLLEDYFSEKSTQYRIKQKTLDLRKLIETNLKRCVKKRDILDKTLKDTEKMEEWRLYGELLTAYMSQVPSGAKVYDAENYYHTETANDETGGLSSPFTNSIVRIRLDETLTPAQNAARYYEKYNKAKRQKKAVLEQLTQNEEELVYLEGLYSMVFSPNIFITESEIAEIRQELYMQGYLKKNPAKKGTLKKSQPLHYISTDGFHIYVGKNNKQNDELTLKFASSKDIWMHTKEIPGSHVIIKVEDAPPTDVALEEGALLAAYYSKAKGSSQVPVDYAMKKNVRKPNGARPGMVIYDNNKTVYVTPAVERINLIKQLQ